MQLIYKNTHIAARRKAAITTQQQVCELLGWGELYYCQFKYERGLQYLGHLVQGNLPAFRALERSRLYWQWWKNHWTMRDEDFLREAQDITSHQSRTLLYRSLHNAEALYNKICPNGVVLAESYTKLAPRIQDELSNPTEPVCAP